MKARRHGPQAVLALAGAIFLSQLAGAVGSVFTVSAIPTWYAGLAKPFFTPPAWVFGPVWVTLYVLMGVALWLVWLARPKTQKPYVFFGVQLVLNALWSILFFGLQQPAIAFAEIVLLWVAVALTLRVFWRVRPAAAWLLVPYLAWVTVAAALNLGVWLLN